MGSLTRSGRTWTGGRLAGAGVAAVAGILGGLLVLHLLQDRLLFFPERGLRITPAYFRMAFEEIRLETSDGETLRCWLLPARDPAAATLLYLHGNAGNIAGRLPFADALQRAGLSVLLVDYRGYGESSGRPSVPGLHRDAEAAWSFLERTRGLPPGRIALFGESIGSHPALKLATRTQEEPAGGPAAVILAGAFTSALDVGRAAYPLLPVRWLMRDPLDNIPLIRGMRAPTLIVQGGSDDLAPPAMGRRLLEASAGQPKRLILVRGAGHGSIYDVDPTLVPAIRDFVADAVERVAGKAPR